MPRRVIFPILLLLVTGSAAGMSVPEPSGVPVPAERTEGPIDLFWVRSMALVENRARGPAQSDETVREALTRWLPGVMQMSTEGAGLLIDYRSFRSAQEVDPSDLHVWFDDAGLEVDPLMAAHERLPDDARRAAPRSAAPGVESRVSWTVDLYRLDCQSPQFGEKPTPAIGGRCENRVYVRVKLGTMQGTADDEASAVQSFAAQLRDAMLMSVPAAEGD